MIKTTTVKWDYIKTIEQTHGIKASQQTKTKDNIRIKNEKEHH